MKKTFTLAALAFCALGANAQSEVWSVTPDFDINTANQTIAATANVDLTVASFLNEKDVEDGATPWSVEAGEGSNVALNTDVCTPKFNNYIKGKGNPYVVDNGGYWEETDNGPAWRDDPNATAWTEGCGQLPVHGMYMKVTTKAAGTMKMGVYVNKGNHATYVVDEATKAHLAASQIKVAFYYQNNTFTIDDNGTTVGFVEGTMPDDFVIQHTNGYTQNRPAMGYITFPVEAGNSYYVFNPKSQIGFYGFEFTQGGGAGINDLTADKADADAPVYNLAGQRVSKQAKGLLIKNGKKFINK